MLSNEATKLNKMRRCRLKLKKLQSQMTKVQSTQTWQKQRLEKGIKQTKNEFNQLTEQLILARYHPLVLCLKKYLIDVILETCCEYMAESFCVRCLASFPKSFGICVNTESQSCVQALLSQRKCTYDLKSPPLFRDDPQQIIACADTEDDDIIQFVMNCFIHKKHSFNIERQTSQETSGSSVSVYVETTKNCELFVVCIETVQEHMTTEQFYFKSKICPQESSAVFEHNVHLLTSNE